MARVSIIAGDKAGGDALQGNVSAGGSLCSVILDTGSAVEWLPHQEPDVVIVDVDSYPRISQLAADIKQTGGQPILALIRGDVLGRASGSLDNVDDFLTKPVDPNELQLRLRRLLRKSQAESGQDLVCGDLKVDLAKCEVFVGDHLVVLTFKEYELLKFLIANRGRVCTRDTLLDKVWGFDYYGGDRTVDVHIRRLRSKIEDPTHSFIETIRNIGYRLRC